MCMKISAVVLAACVAVCGAPMFADTAATPPDLSKIKMPEYAIKMIERDPVQALSQYYGMAFRLAPDGIVTQEMLDAQQEFQVARMRANRLASMLGYDLDGDGVISAQELARLEKYSEPSRKASLLVMLDTYDTNRDGAISLDELLAAAKAQNAKNTEMSSRYQPVTSVNILMQMDVNGDGKTTPDEIRAVVDAVAARATSCASPCPPG